MLGFDCARLDSARSPAHAQDLMEELGTPPKLMDERMGHADGSVQARYTQVTAPMSARLLDSLTGE